MPNSQPKTLCILRFSALGDITHMLPIIRTLQSEWPECKITWIIGKLEYQLVNGLEGIEFIIFDKSRGFRAYIDLYRTIKNRQFDVLLHMQAALRASLASLTIKAPIKIGFDPSRSADFQHFFSNKVITTPPRQHVLDGFFGFLEALGISQRHMRWDVPIPQDAKDYANTLCAQHAHILVINACTSVRSNNYRNWKAESYAKVIDYANTLGLQTILTGGPAENEINMAEKIIDHAKTPIINTVGKTSIKQLLAILEKADIIIAPDTGPLHMGTAVGTPVIGLYVTSNPYRTGPYNDLDKVVNLYPQAVEAEFKQSVDALKWGKRVRNPDMIDLITVDAVTSQLQETFNSIKQSNQDNG